jgi:hypothetical protein
VLVSFPNTAPIGRGEKSWGVVLAFVMFPIGLLAAIGLLAGWGWSRWLALVLSGIMVVAGVAVAIWLVVAVLPGANYPFGPWFVFAAGLAAILGLFAARAYLAGLRSPETEED